MTLIYIISGLYVLQLGAFAYLDGKQRQAHAEERALWLAERTALLDRLQSGSFAEYKSQEIRLVKAQNGVEEKTVVIEQL